MENYFGEQTLESMNQAEWYNQWTFKQFNEFLKGKILEVGCGIGNFTKSLLGFGDIYAIDIREDYVEKTKKLLKKTAVHVGVGDIEKGKYFFNNKKFNSIICLNVLEHIQNDNQSIKNLYKLLKKDGILILLIPSHSFLYGEIDKNIGHFRRYEKDKIINKLKRIGFSILRTRRLNILGAVGWYIAGKILKSNIVENDNIKIFNFLAPVILPFENVIEPPIGTSILIIAKKTNI